MKTLTKISAIAAATIAAAVIGTTPAAATPPDTYTAITTPATTNNTPPTHTIECGIFTTPTTQHTITAELPVAPVGASHLTTL